MFLIIGTHFFTWGAQRMQTPTRCSRCGATQPFIEKKGMRFITLFFIVPVLPISGVKHLIECPNCKARYEMR